jgi:hypothetical protein
VVVDIFEQRLDWCLKHFFVETEEFKGRSGIEWRMEMQRHGRKSQGCMEHGIRLDEILSICILLYGTLPHN